jgi:hypothetical protein
MIAHRASGSRLWVEGQLAKLEAEQNLVGVGQITDHAA